MDFEIPPVSPLWVYSQGDFFIESVSFFIKYPNFGKNTDHKGYKIGLHNTFGFEVFCAKYIKIIFVNR